LEKGKGAEGLGEWVRGGDDRPKIIDFLSSLMGDSRLARALAIPDEDVSIKIATDEKIVAKIRDYQLTMEFGPKTIIHDCGIGKGPLRLASCASMLGKFCCHCLRR